MHGRKEHGSQIMIMSVRVHNSTTYKLSQSKSPSTSCVSMHGRKEYGSQIMITSVYLILIAQLTD